jgi:hypothetical protein
LHFGDVLALYLRYQRFLRELFFCSMRWTTRKLRRFDIQLQRFGIFREWTPFPFKSIGYEFPIVARMGYPKLISYIRKIYSDCHNPMQHA